MRTALLAAALMIATVTSCGGGGGGGPTPPNNQGVGGSLVANFSYAVISQSNGEALVEFSVLADAGVAWDLDFGDAGSVESGAGTGSVTHTYAYGSYIAYLDASTTTDSETLELNVQVGGGQVPTTYAPETTYNSSYIVPQGASPFNYRLYPYEVTGDNFMDLAQGENGVTRFYSGSNGSSLGAMGGEDPYGATGAFGPDNRPYGARDLDGDGQLEVVALQNQFDQSTSTYTSSFSVYSASGFSLEYTSGTYSGLLNIQIAEVDGDSAHELVCNLSRGNSEIDTFVLKGSVGYAATYNRSYIMPQGASSSNYRLYPFEVTGDNVMDLAQGENGVTRFYSGSNGSSLGAMGGENPYGATGAFGPDNRPYGARDLDGDGQLEVVALQYQFDQSTSTGTSSFSVYSANGFSLEYTSGTYSGLLNIQIAEVDGDSAHELVCNLSRGNSEIDTFVLKGSVGYAATYNRSYIVPQGASSFNYRLYPFEVTGDNVMDLAQGENGVTRFYSGSNGSSLGAMGGENPYGATGAFGPDNRPYGARDLDGDGQLEVVALQNQFDQSTSTYTSSFSVYSANGFSLEYTSGTYSGLLNIQIAEVDGDSAHELVCNLSRGNSEIDTFVLRQQ